ncbi:DUF5682 family protein [Streptomyces sp. NPDC004111]|uniref:DUF5682 family protein n=1 Tax=Streptomyces sp. NPDC004111 TaxID=3364690 RepID=UPI00368D899B
MSTVGKGAVRFLGVRHHSPACARLVARTVAELRPAYVLVEGPADMNGRLEELLLGHDLPVAVFSHYRDEERAATSWTPLCDYSPEWVALTAGRAAGAEVRFVDLPAWHPAFAERTNRYADAEARYAEATDRLRERFTVDSVDALWDRLFEVEPEEGLAERLDAYFDLVRGEAAADSGDRAREEYMASWVRAAARAAGDRPVLVVTGGFHTPALRRLAGAEGTGAADAVTDRTAGAGGGVCWPEVPVPADGALSGSFLVPYSFRQLDAFAGYQSGMPSPGYYQRVWEDGVEAAAEGLTRTVVARLRERRHPVSTADLIAARALTEGLTALRGHPRPARTDVLDGLAGALVADDLDQPLPWTGRGTLAVGSHPVVVEMVAACGGDRTGRLHPLTPVPPLVHEVAAELAGLRIRPDEQVRLDLGAERDLARSRLLHRLRVLGVPGHERVSGPAHGADPVFTERWEPGDRTGRDAALVEAGAYGARLDEAAATVLTERARAAGPDGLASALFDAVLCGVGGVSDRLLSELASSVREMKDPGPLGEVLATALGLWRHDRLFDVARGPLLGSVVDAAAVRLLWLLEGLRGAPGVDLGRLRAVVALRDSCVHAARLLGVEREAVAAAARRISLDSAAPADLRGAAFALHRELGAATGSAGPAEAVRGFAGAGGLLGDWLAGLFAVARAEVTRDGDGEDSDEAGGEGGVGVDGGGGEGRGGGAGRAGGTGRSLVGVLDSIVGAMSDEEFLVALPSLRQAFAFFPPRERERIARRLMERRGVRGSARGLLRTGADPLVTARGRALEESVDAVLGRFGLDAVTPADGERERKGATA